MVYPGDEFGFFQDIHVGTDVKVVISPMTTKLGKQLHLELTHLQLIMQVILMSSLHNHVNLKGFHYYL